MNAKVLSALILCLTFPSAAAASPGTFPLLVDLDREVSGLLDAYLEAVPECPVLPDTPLRMWLLDLAWLRAGAAIDELMELDGEALFPEDSSRSVWDEYVTLTGNLFEVFSEIQSAYHGPLLPDSAVSVELEARLLEADSAWRRSEMVLFELLSEEGIQ
ncbi:MAG: hypothetical protein R6U39_06670 [Candidatus Aegiribacteria sp.]